MEFLMIFSVKLRKEKKKIHSASPTDFQAENEKDVTFRVVVVIYFAVIAVRSQKMCVCIFFKGFHSRTSKSNSLWQLF